MSLWLSGANAAAGKARSAATAEMRRLQTAALKQATAAVLAPWRGDGRPASEAAQALRSGVTPIVT